MIKERMDLILRECANVAVMQAMLEIEKGNQLADPIEQMMDALKIIKKEFDKDQKKAMSHE